MKFVFAKREDTAKILDLITELENEIVTDVPTLEYWLFDAKKAEVLFVEEEGEKVGYALFFHNFSTFLGRAGIYLEDLFVKPAYRGRGLGKGLLTELARITVERGCGRLEWACLDWNQPSIDFYHSMGAKAMDEWTVYRLTGATLEALGKNKS